MSGTSFQHLDSETIQSLRDLTPEDQPDFLKELLSLFVQSSPDRIKKLTQAFQAGDLKTVGLEAHTLKSSSANIGAMKLSEICQEIEKAARGGTLPSNSPLIDQLSAEFQNVDAELKTLPELKA